MMNMLSSVQSFESAQHPDIAFLYRDVAAPMEQEHEAAAESAAKAQVVPPGPTMEDLAQALASARTEAIAETTARLKLEMESHLAVQAGKIEGTISAFVEERRSYFARVESDVVHLALAIAAKILHREAQVDPLLIAALVKVAINKLHDGSRVTVRVAAAEVDRWRESLANPSNGSTIQIVEERYMVAGDCILETEMGSANFSIEAQLKEVEQGFFDLLAQRPAVR
jgi:flagellar assembly protein FliH